MNYTCGVKSTNSQLTSLKNNKIFLLDIRLQLNEQLKSLEQRIETQISIVTEIQEYFRRRADVELDYAKNLDNLHKQISQKHRAQKARLIFLCFEKFLFSNLSFFH